MPVFAIDVSNWNGAVNLTTAKANGVQAVICKTSEGTGFIDSFAAGTLAQAKALGIPGGGYHFLRGGVSGAAQADLHARLTNGFAGVIPALDVEVAGAGSQVLSYLDEFVKLVPGRKLMVYSNRGLWAAAGGPSDLSQWPVVGWHAGYINGAYAPASGALASIWNSIKCVTSSFANITSFPMIQFTDRAAVPGVGSSIDGNAWTGTIDELWALTGSAPSNPQPTLGEHMSYLAHCPDGSIYMIDSAGKRGLVGNEWTAYRAAGFPVAEIDQATANAIPNSPTVKDVTTSVLAGLPAWVTAVTPPAVTVDVNALATDLVPHLPAALDPTAVAAQLAPLLHSGVTIDDIKALLTTLKITTSTTLG